MRAKRFAPHGAEVELARDPGALGGGHRHAARLDVVGMVVRGVLVVRDDDVGTVFLEEPGQTAGGLVDRDVAEGVLVTFVLPVGHPRIAVAEELQVRDAEDLARALELIESCLHDELLVVAFGVRLDPAGQISELAVGARHDDCGEPLGRVAGEHSARARCLIVGMGMDGHERRHDGQATRKRP